MSLQPQTIKDITDKVSKQYLELITAVNNINNDNPDYFPLITQDDDYGFELRMIGCVAKSDNWNISDILKNSPIPPVINSLNTYFQSDSTLSDVGVGGALDNYLYINDLTAYKYYADAQYYTNFYKMCGILVENTDAFTFAEFGIDEYDNSYFESIDSYQTEDRNRPYGVYPEYTSYAPTDQVEILIVSGNINFDIHLICKDKNGDTFIFEQTISGSAGDKVKLNLTEKITGCSGLSVSYLGSGGDLLRIQTIAPEV